MNKLNIETVWIDGCEQWITEHRKEGWAAVYLNFMFEPLYGTTAGIIEQMKKAIHREFYVPFMLKYVRNPHRKAEQEWMPRLMLFPDRPVPKREKASIRELTINSGGLHFNGPMLVPPKSRFFDFPVEHIRENQRLYVREKIARVHAKYMDDDFGRVADYSAKSVRWGKADPDDILMLPKKSSEMRQEPSVMTAEQKAIKDIMSAHNVNRELAWQMYRAQSRSAA